MNNFLNFLNVINQQPYKEFSLVTVIKVQGSAYRHEGAKMLFRRDGKRFGTISAGCLEEDLSYYALEVIKNKKSKVLTYDLRAEHDALWGQGAGCNGAITVFIEYVYSHTDNVWLKMENALDQGQRLLCSRSIDSSFNRIEVINKDTGVCFGNTTQQSLSFRAAQEKKLNIYHQEIYGEVLIENFEPKNNLYIFGAGPDVNAVVDLAVQLDFSVTIIDPRSDLCHKNNFPRAHTLVIQHPETFLHDNRFPPR
ncbi:XdhC family protein [Alteribacillus sp. YIM 98480]|uniref:XdhC family protein n=1 Tax=Alteribacillus sp. YIM 98480 TaxID=2606599 RepID=UPI00131E2AE7|nr:XdhC family protein [Alteribacillus sp. YIM 98480]